jgi:hypothetical protein
LSIDAALDADGESGPAGVADVRASVERPPLATKSLERVDVQDAARKAVSTATVTSRRCRALDDVMALPPLLTR